MKCPLCKGSRVNVVRRHRFVCGCCRGAGMIEPLAGIAWDAMVDGALYAARGLAREEGAGMAWNVGYSTFRYAEIAQKDQLPASVEGPTHRIVGLLLRRCADA